MNNLFKAMSIWIISTIFLTTATAQTSDVNFSILKDDRDVTVTRSDQIIYDFDYSNFENRELVDLVLEDTIPEGTTFALGALWECDGYTEDDIVPAGTVCTYNLGNVPIGAIDQSLDGLITLTIIESTTLPSITNTIRVLENGNEELATSTVTTPIVSPFIFAQIASDTEEYQCFEQIPYTVSLENVGEVTANSVDISLELPEGYEFVDDDGWSCDDNFCTFEYGQLEVGETDELEFELISNTTDCEEKELTLDLDLNLQNINEENAFKTVNVVTPLPSLEISKELSDIRTLEEDEEYIATIKIVLSNTGDTDIADIALEENLEESLITFDEFEFIKAWSDECDLNTSFDGSSTINIIESLLLGAGEDCTLYYEVRLKDDEDDEYNVDSVATGISGSTEINVQQGLVFELEFDNDDEEIQEDEENEREENNHNNDDDDHSEGSVLGTQYLADTGMPITYHLIFASIMILSVLGIRYIK